MKLLRLLLFLILGGVAAYFLVPQVRIAVYALLLVPHFFPGDVPRPLERITAAPSMETIAVPGAPGRLVADVYRPAGDGRHPVMILLLGVSPLPRSHPQVTTLSTGIARTGIVTVVAESQALLDGEIRAEEIDNLVALFQHLERDAGVDPTRIGFAGFCVGAVLELLAAGDERIADRVAYVNGFSVYASARDVLRDILTETQPGPDGLEPWSPSELTRTVFRRHLIDQLPLASDRELLSGALLTANALPPATLVRLSPAGLALAQLLATRDPAQVEMLLAALPPEYLAPLDRLSPGRAAGRIRARVFLMHDASDSYLPVSGARQLATLVPAATRPQYTEFRLFSHVVPGGVDDPLRFAGEMLKLLGHINAVLQTAHLG
jgi:dienelactone hydrolase